MYVVRFSFPDREPSFKAFSARPDALRWFEAASELIAGEVVASERVEATAALFEVLGEDDARAAVEAVKAGHATILDRHPAKAD